MEEEWVPLVDENGNIKGQAPRSLVHNGTKLLHPVVHMHVLYRNMLLLQKRQITKQIQPGKWDTAVGGHVSAGESIEQALTKEAFEEMGLKEFNPRFLDIYRWDSEVESELVYLFVTDGPKSFSFNPEEVKDARYWTKEQIKEQTGQEVFTPNLEFEIQLLKEKGIF